MAVRAPDGTMWTGASGHAVVPLVNGAPVTIEMTTDLHFRIASTSKSLTATIILQLVDDGTLALDESLDQIMARWFAPGYIDFAIPYSDVITLRNLLEMRSGMADYASTAAFAALMLQQPPEPVDPRELIRMSVQSTTLASHAPDVEMEYCLRTWVTALVDGSMISPAMQEERMKMKPGYVETWPVDYGLGIYDDNGAIGHYGNCAKFYTTYAMRYASYDIAVLTNGELQEHSDPGRHPARSIFWNAVRDAGISE